MKLFPFAAAALLAAAPAMAAPARGPSTYDTVAAARAVAVCFLLEGYTDVQQTRNLERRTLAKQGITAHQVAQIQKLESFEPFVMRIIEKEGGCTQWMQRQRIKKQTRPAVDRPFQWNL